MDLNILLSKERIDDLQKSHPPWRFCNPLEPETGWNPISSEFLQHICLKMLLLRESYRCSPSHFHSIWRKCFSRMNLRWQLVGPNIFFNFISLPYSESLQRDAECSALLRLYSLSRTTQSTTATNKCWRPRTDCKSVPNWFSFRDPLCSLLLFPLFQTHFLLPLSSITTYCLLSFGCHFPRLLEVQEIQRSWSHKSQWFIERPYQQQDWSAASEPNAKKPLPLQAISTSTGKRHLTKQSICNRWAAGIKDIWDSSS